MSTYREIAERVNRVKPHAFDEETVLYWLTELDGMLAAEVFLMDVNQIAQLQHRFPEGLEHEPLVGFPYEGIYDAWVKAKIDLENGEYDKYQNQMAAYNSMLKSFKNWFLNTYDPAQGYMREAEEYAEEDV